MAKSKSTKYLDKDHPIYKEGLKVSSHNKSLQNYIKAKEQFESIITISPLTPVATHYHIRNGAKLIKINPTSQNFQYSV